MSGSDPKPTTSDAELIDSARSGDTSAFAELWRRHFRPAARVARQFTSIDADDLVSEAYARIFQRVLAGGGPTGAFRPYLYTTIRNLASTWGAASSHDVQVDAQGIAWVAGLLCVAALCDLLVQLARDDRIALGVIGAIVSLLVVVRLVFVRRSSGRGPDDGRQTAGRRTRAAHRRRRGAARGQVLGSEGAGRGEGA